MFKRKKQPAEPTLRRADRPFLSDLRSAAQVEPTPHVV
jgi:hypothetical protein